MLERMEKFIKASNTGCTLWLGAKDKDGYPMFWYNRKTSHASRVLWEFVNGKIPTGLVVMHTCDNPECLNLQHLQLGTKKQNTEDAKAKGRMTGPVKVTEDIKQEIIARRKQKQSLGRIGKDLGLSASTIHNYCK